MLYKELGWMELVLSITFCRVLRLEKSKFRNSNSARSKARKKRIEQPNAGHAGIAAVRSAMEDCLERPYGKKILRRSPASDPQGASAWVPPLRKPDRRHGASHTGRLSDLTLWEVTLVSKNISARKKRGGSLPFRSVDKKMDVGRFSYSLKNFIKIVHPF